MTRKRSGTAAGNSFTNCASKAWQYEIISDLGSGMNYRKKGLWQLLNLIVSGQVERLVITHKDSLLRFGEELVFALCEARGCGEKA